VGGIGIKVGIMVPACCECNPGGRIADPLFPEAPVFAKVSAQVWDEGCGRGMGRALRSANHTRQREENE